MLVLSVLAVMLMSFHSLEAQPSAAGLPAVEVNHADGSPIHDRAATATPASHCNLSVACHTTGMIADAATPLFRCADSVPVWPRNVFSLHGRTITVPTPPPLSPRA